MAGFAKQASAAVIVMDACGLLGLPVPALVAGNPSDVTARQMWALLRTVGRRLCKPTNGHRWQVLTRLWALPTVPGTTLYALPEDWDSFIDTTAWNTTSRLPLIGPAAGPQWQALKARAIGPSTLSIVYRTVGGRFELYESPSTPQALTIEYTSRGWVRESGSTPEAPVYTDAPADDGDIVLFDPELTTALLQRAFMEAKGFDTNAISGTCERLMEAAISADQDAPVLSVDGTGVFPLLNPYLNLPDTGYGGA